MLHILSDLWRHTLPPPNAQWLWLLWLVVAFLVFGGILFGLLQMVPNRFRKTFIAIVTFLAGLIYSVEFFVPAGTDGRNFLTGFTEQAEQVLTIVSAFVLGLGIYSLLRFHGKNLAKKREGWPYNLAFFLAFFAMLLAGFWKDMGNSQVSASVYDVLYRTTVIAPGATMFSIIGFYIVSAAYRAFRIRSGEATLMLIAAFIVMLGQVTIGSYITHGLPDSGILGFLKLDNLSYWILRYPNSAAQRGISFGIEVGALAMALRIWLSLERGSFFEQEL